MDASQVAAEILVQWEAFKAATVIYITGAVLVGVIVWWFRGHILYERIKGKDDHIAALKDQIEHHKQLVKEAQAAQAELKTALEASTRQLVTASIRVDILDRFKGLSPIIHTVDEKLDEISTSTSTFTSLGWRGKPFG
jgi:hypothetical protein